MQKFTRIGERLKNLRGEKTRKEVSKELGVSKSAIAMYERGERVPRDNVKIKIAKFYNMSVEDIFYTENVHEM